MKAFQTSHVNCDINARVLCPGISRESAAHNNKTKKPRVSATERGHWHVLVPAAACAQPLEGIAAQYPTDAAAGPVPDELPGDTAQRSVAASAALLHPAADSQADHEQPMGAATRATGNRQSGSLATGPLLHYPPEGSDVHEESRGLPGDTGHYHRLLVTCDHHGCPMSGRCKKTRSFGVRSAAKLGMGDIEPYAYLGAWLEQRQNFLSREGHQSLVPAAGDVKSYGIRKLGWQP